MGQKRPTLKINLNMKHVLPVLFTGLLALLAAPLSAQTVDQSVYDIIAASEAHDTLEAAIVAAGLDDELNTEDDDDTRFTVFAPTDTAFQMLFDMLPAGALQDLLTPANQDSLVGILSYHVVPDSVASDMLMDGMYAGTLSEGDSVYIRVGDDGVFVNMAMVITADLIATNGVVHVIDAVLLPPMGTVTDYVVDTDTLSTLETAVVAAGLDSALATNGPFTLFAPSNDAFAALDADSLQMLLDDPMGNLSTILRYHVVPGMYYSDDLMDGMTLMTLQGEMLEVSIMNDTVMVDGVMITMPDMMVENGIVHVINGVLLPYGSTGTQEPAYAREVSIFPNPTSSQLFVELPASILNDATLTLRDLSGRTVASRRATNDREPIEVGGLSAGVYLLEIRATAGTIQRKVMVQR